MSAAERRRAGRAGHRAGRAARRRCARRSSARWPPSSTGVHNIQRAVEVGSVRRGHRRRRAAAAPHRGRVARPRPPTRLADQALDRAHLVGGVERGDLVGLGEGRVVEHRVDQMVDGAAARHDRLPDVHELGGVRPEDVDAEQLPRVGRDEQLEHAVRVAHDLAASELAVARDADLVGDRRPGEVVLGLAAVADLRDRVDADRLEGEQRVDRLVEGGVRREPALLHGGGRERREADDVPDGEDVVDLGPEVGPDLDAAALVGGQADIVQVQGLGGALRGRLSTSPCRPGSACRSPAS